MRNFVRLFIKNILRLITVNLLFVFWGVLIITLPAAYTAMIKVVGDIAEEGETVETTRLVVKAFLRAFKSNFFQATVYGWGAILLCTGFGYGIWFYGQWDNAGWGIFPQMLATLCVLMIYTSTNPAVVMIGKVSLPLNAVIKNSFLLIIIESVRVIGCAVIQAVVMVLCICQIHHMFPCVLTIGFALMGLIKVTILKPVIQKYICV